MSFSSRRDPRKPGEDIFVGRGRELRELGAALEDGRSGRGRLLLVAGDPGMGKTRLLTELASRAPTEDARVLWGRCGEAGGAPAYWPWIQILRELASGLPRSEIARALGRRLAFLTTLVPELRPASSELSASPPVPLESENARFYLFDEVTTFLNRVSECSPLLLLLDDLHAGDASSLLLLRFAARSALRGSRIVVVGTYRTREARQSQETVPLLEAVSREGSVLTLSGLDESDITKLVTDACGLPASEPEIASLRRATEGNPFFVRELSRLPRRYVAEVVPLRLRETLRAGLDESSADCRMVLEAASAIGQEFDLSLVSSVCELPESRLLPALDDAAARGFVGPIEGRLRFGFPQPLLRETVYDEIPAHRRAPLHRRLAETIERWQGAEPELHLAELAHHYSEAARDGSDPTRAIDFNRRAGDRAASLLAFEDAGRHYQRALELSKDADPSLRSELLLRAGEASNRAGAPDTARDAFQRAAELARRVGDSDRLARAALGYGVLWLDALTVDPVRVGLLEEGLAALPSDDGAVRARLLARLALALYWSDRTAERFAASEEAVAMARRLGDGTTLAYALEARHYALWNPNHVEERLAVATEMVEVARGLEDLELELRGRTWRFLDLMEIGDVREADRELAVRAALAEDLREPQQLALVRVSRAMRAQLEGRFEEAERIAREAHAIGHLVQPLNADIRLLSMLFVCLRERGRRQALEEVESAYRGLLEKRIVPTVARCCLAALAVDGGRMDEAREIFELLAERDFAALVSDVTWQSNVTLAAEVCAALGDVERAAVLYRKLLPHRERTLLRGAGLTCDGFLSRHLGMLAATMGRHEEALRHFEDALARNEGMRARPATAHARYECARALLARGAAGDREGARALVTGALATAEALDMGMLRSKAAAFLSEMRRADETRPPDRPSEDQALDGNVFRLEEGSWTISFQGKVLRVSDAKGIRYLAYLVARAGRDVPVLDLESAVDGGPAVSSIEQLRVNVTKSLRAAIRNLATLDAALGGHLDGAVHTGRILSYRPSAERTARRT